VSKRTRAVSDAASAETKVARYPHSLVSPFILSGSKWTWAIAGVSVSLFAPRWARQKTARLGFLARTVVYLDASGRVHGQGRAWIPVSRHGLQLFLALRGFLAPRRLVGTEASRLFGTQLTITILASDSCTELFSPFSFNAERVQLTRKLLTGPEGTLVAIVEERFFFELMSAIVSDSAPTSEGVT